MNGIDDGEVLANKTSQRALLQGGSLASGKSLRPMVMWPCAFQIGWILESPTSSVENPATGKRHSCIHVTTPSGGATGASFITWLRANFIDTHDRNDRPLHHEGALFKASPSDPVVVIIDGHATHFEPDVVKFCMDNGIHLVL